MVKLREIRNAAALVDYDGTRSVAKALEHLEYAQNIGQLSGISGTGDAITANAPPALSTYQAGQTGYFFASESNTASVPTIRIGALDIIPIQNNVGGPLAPNDIVRGSPYRFRISIIDGAFVLRIIDNLPSQLFASPEMTGFPRAPTPSYVSNSTALATTGFVQLLRQSPILSLNNVMGINTITADAPLGFISTQSGQTYRFVKTDGDNTGDVTLQIGNSRDLPIRKANNQPLSAGDLELGQWYEIRNVSNDHYEIVGTSATKSDVVASAMAQVSGTYGTAISTAARRAAARSAYSWSPNLIADPYLKEAASTIRWGNDTLNIVEKNQMRSVEIPAQGATAISIKDRFWCDVSAIPDGTPISVSVVITQKDGISPTSHRLRLYAYQADQTTQVNIGGNVDGNDVPGDAGPYSRYLPAEAITQPRQVVIWEGFPKPANVGLLVLDMRLQNSPATYLSGFCVRVGDDPSLNADHTLAPRLSGGQASSITIAPDGRDNYLGSADSPMATLNAAIDALGGDGTIFVKGGDYHQQRIDPKKVTGTIRIIGSNAAAPHYDLYPRFILSSPVTGITKTNGYTKVYQAAVPDLPALDKFNWAYQDGVSDPRTLIADEDRQPAHRGRTHRLMDMAKLIKTSATTLAEALAEIDAAGANEPKAFVDQGILYFSIVGGGDARAATIYLDGAGLVEPAGRLSCGQITMHGLDVRYGGVNLTPFRHARLSEVQVIGSQGNAVDYSVLEFASLEVACAGSMGGSLGDGLNGHLGAKVTGFVLYSHDNQDDCFSDHEGCTSRLYIGLGEASGGTCLAPAYGADHEAYNFTSLRNQKIPNRKPAAFAVLERPQDVPTPDDGMDTRALWVGCVSIGDSCGFTDSGSIASRGVARDCKVRDMRSGASYGYSGTMQIEDCRFSSANGEARRFSVAVHNTELVT